MGLGAPLIALDRLKGKKERGEVSEAGGQEDRVSRKGGRSAKEEVRGKEGGHVGFIQGESQRQKLE